MLDSVYRRQADAFWDRLGRVVSRTGVSANDVTLAGFALSAANSALFVVHRKPLVFGVCLALTELLDSLDGGVARVTGTRSRWGSLLDAATDRYKESLSLLAVAVVTGYWLVCFLALAGSLLTSYNHARAAMEGATASASVPDLFERLERVATLVAGLVLQGLLPPGFCFGEGALFAALLVLALFSHLTALQRLLRARRALAAIDAGDRR